MKKNKLRTFALIATAGFALSCGACSNSSDVVVYKHFEQSDKVLHWVWDNDIETVGHYEGTMVDYVGDSDDWDDPRVSGYHELTDKKGNTVYAYLFKGIRDNRLEVITYTCNEGQTNYGYDFLRNFCGFNSL